MKALIPTFFMTVTYSSGSAIAFPVYETTLITLGGVQVVISDIIIPCIKGYFLLNMANYLMEKDYLLKMADLFQSVISYGLKIILFVITGINFIQNMIINNSSAIPAQFVRKAGNEILTATSVIYGAGKIIKNAVGLSGIVALIRRQQIMYGTYKDRRQYKPAYKNCILYNHGIFSLSEHCTYFLRLWRMIWKH